MTTPFCSGQGVLHYLTDRGNKLIKYLKENEFPEDFDVDFLIACIEEVQLNHASVSREIRKRTRTREL